MTPFTAVLLIAAACFVQLAEAVPLMVSETRRDIADPPVLAPNASTVWVVGETQTVTWDTSTLPEQITNTQGTVLLGFMNDTTGNEHLMIDSPLASGFDIRSGSVDVVVPDVDPRTDYIIALLGDSGNISNKFTIKTSSGSVTSSATTSSTAAPASESSPPPEPTVSSLSSPNAPSESSLSLAITSLTSLTTIPPVSTGSLEALSSQSDSASPSPSNTGTTTSSASIRISYLRPAKFVVPILCMFFLT